MGRAPVHGKAMSNAQRSSLNRQKAKDELQVAQDNADRLRSEADTLRANIGMLQARQDQQELINQARLQYDLAQNQAFSELHHMPTTEILEAWRAAHPPLPEGLQLSEEEADHVPVLSVSAAWQKANPTTTVYQLLASHNLLGFWRMTGGALLVRMELKATMRRDAARTSPAVLSLAIDAKDDCRAQILVSAEPVRPTRCLSTSTANPAGVWQQSTEISNTPGGARTVGDLVVAARAEKTLVPPDVARARQAIASRLQPSKAIYVSVDAAGEPARPSLACPSFAMVSLDCAPVSGLTTPMLYINPRDQRSTFSVHIEDMQLAAVNTLLADDTRADLGVNAGAKIWVIVHPDDVSVFEKLVGPYVEGWTRSGKDSHHQGCEQRLRPAGLVVDPAILVEYGIRHKIAIQRVGDQVIVHGRAYHWGVNVGPSVAWAVNLLGAGPSLGCRCGFVGGPDAASFM